jgi:general secretion pathway protein K
MTPPVLSPEPSAPSTPSASPSGAAPRPRRAARRFGRPRLVRGKLFASKQRGIALVMVMIAISIILAITNQFGTNATIDMMAAANYRDQMRAHFLARSALNISELVIRMQAEVESQFKGVQITDYADQLMMAFCGDRNEISEALGVPVDKLKGLGGEIGNCGLTPTITTDDGKINLNCALATDPKDYAQVRKRIENLIGLTAYDPIFDDDDAEGWRRNRETQVASLLDYVDKDVARFQDRGTNEDYGYESLRDPYKSKQRALDTVGEIKQIRGIDDRFWALFGNAFTVYGGCKVAINAVDDVPSLAAILGGAAEDPADAQNHPKLYALASIIIKAREFGQTFKNVDAFIKFAKDPESAFSLDSGTSSGGSGAARGIFADALRQAGVPPGVKPGIALKKDNLPPMEFKGRRTYRVTAWGEITRAQVDDKGNPIFPPVRRTVTGVWDVKPTPQAARPSATNPNLTAGNGAWVFLKEE